MGSWRLPMTEPGCPGAEVITGPKAWTSTQAGRLKMRGIMIMCSCSEQYLELLT